MFWDADVFVLPVLAAIRPAAARAMLEYRCTPPARGPAAAQASGREGARFPWESAGDGSEVTPASARGRVGQLIPIRTGQHEVHIVADVAWAAELLRELERRHRISCWSRTCPDPRRHRSLLGEPSPP